MTNINVDMIIIDISTPDEREHLLGGGRPRCR